MSELDPAAGTSTPPLAHSSPRPKKAAGRPRKGVKSHPSATESRVLRSSTHARHRTHFRHDQIDAARANPADVLDVSMDSEASSARAYVTNFDGGISNNILVDNRARLMNMMHPYARIYSATPLTLNIDGFTPFFDAMYNYFCKMLAANPVGFNRRITNVDFVRVCRFLLKGRLDNILREYGRQNPDNRIIITDTFLMPKCLAEVLNGLGGVLVNSKALTIYPIMAAEIVQMDRRIHRMVTHEMQEEYITFVYQLEAAGITKATPMTHVKDGTRWWATTVRDNANAIANGNNQVVRVFTQVTEATPSDMLIAAIVQHGMEATFPPLLRELCQSELVININSLREAFFLIK